MATAAEAQTRVRAPKSGVYDGSTSQHRKLSLQIGGKTVSQLVFRFPCGTVQGTAAIQDLKIVRRDSRFRFRTLIYAGVQYTDQESENAPIRIRGTFYPSGNRVRGRARVTTDRCGVTRFRWWAKRRTAG